MVSAMIARGGEDEVKKGGGYSVILVVGSDCPFCKIGEPAKIPDISCLSESSVHVAFLSNYGKKNASIT